MQAPPPPNTHTSLDYNPKRTLHKHDTMFSLGYVAVNVHTAASSTTLLPRLPHCGQVLVGLPTPDLASAKHAVDTVQRLLDSLSGVRKCCKV